MADEVDVPPNEPPPKLFAITLEPCERHVNDVPTFPKNGIGVVSDIQKQLKDRDILSCVSGDHALQYYRAPLVVCEHILVVPTRKFKKVKHFIETEMQAYHAVPRTKSQERKDNTNQRRVYSSSIHLRHNTHLLDIWFTPANVVCLDSVFEEPDIRMVLDPFGNATVPALKEFVQSALDRPAGMDLQDLVDGLNLDSDWAASVGLNFVDGSNELWPSGIPANRRLFWDETVSEKKRRSLGKNDPKLYATKYRLYRDGKAWKNVRCRGDEPEKPLRSRKHVTLPLDDL